MRELSPLRLCLGLTVSLLAWLDNAAAVASNRPHLRPSFVENLGQLARDVAFYVPGRTESLAVMRGGRIAHFLNEAEKGNPTLTETFVAGKPGPTAGHRAATNVSYFLGDDPRRWQRDLPTFDDIQLGEVWPGVAVSLHARDGRVEKVFSLGRGALVRRIRVRLTGISALRLEQDGALLARVRDGEVRFTPPIAYQDRNGTRLPVRVVYSVGRSSYGFRLGRHDPALPVVIDPILQSTYIGGADADSVNAMVIDASTGDVIVGGHSYSNPGRGVDGFVARFDSTLKTLRHFTYVGGSDGDEILSVTVHPVTGDVYVAGFTTSTDFPGTTAGAQPHNAASEDGFVARLDSTLTSILGATYFGGHNVDKVVGVAVHPSTGEVFIAGKTMSADLPGTVGAGRPDFNADLDGFVARLDPTLARLNQTTYLSNHRSVLHTMTIHRSTGEILVGGHGDVTASLLGRLDPSLRSPAQFTFIEAASDIDLYGIAIDPLDGDVLATGWTLESGLPGAEGGAQPTARGAPGDVDAYVVRYDSSLTTLRQSTFLGGSDADYGYAIAVDTQTGDVYVAGETLSTDLPATTGAAQQEPGGGFDGFVARLDPNLTRFVRTTYLGAGGDDTPLAISVHPGSGEVLVAGETTSPSFPGAPCGARPSYAGGAEFFGGDGFVTRLSADLLDNSQEFANESCREPVLLESRDRRPRPIGPRQ